MITLTTPATETVVACPHCERPEGVVTFGSHRGGNPRYRCRDCGRTFCLNPGTTAHPPEFRAMVLRAYQERSSMRGICRTFGIGRNTLYAWLAEKK
jgi:transposase-like protein